MDEDLAPTSGRRPRNTSVGFTLSQLGFATSRRFGEIVGSLGLEPRHFAVLHAAGDDAGQSQQALAERLAIPASTMVALVDHLESQGLLERRRHPDDRRTHTLHLTPKGVEMVGRIVKLGDELERRIADGFSIVERAELMALLNRIAENLGVAPGALPDQGTGQRPEPVPG